MKRTNPVDISLFDGHMLILHAVNGMLSLLVLWTVIMMWHGLPELISTRQLESFTPFVRSLGNRVVALVANRRLTLLLYYVMLAFIPVAIAVLAHRNFDVRRGTSLEKDHFDNWRAPSLRTGVPIYKTEPNRENPDLAAY